MVRLEEKREVARSVKDCFRYLRDFSTIEQWDPGVFRAEKLTPGAPRVGSEFLLSLNSGGNPVPMRYRLLELEPNVRLVLEGKGEKFQVRDIIEFRKLPGTQAPNSDERTEIHYVAELSFQGAMASLEPVLKPWLKRVGKKALDGLKQALESPNSPGFDPGLQDSLRPSVSLRERLIIPGAWEFTKKGYFSMPDKSLSEWMGPSDPHDAHDASQAAKTVVITGPTSGIGLAAACELSRLGAHLVLVGRNVDKLRRSKAAILNWSGAKAETISWVECELSSIQSVEAAASQILRDYPKVDVLIHNAGALLAAREENEAGLEKTFAVHVLAPWILTEQLRPALSRASGRVILVSSGGMYTQKVDLKDLQSVRGTYDGAKVYARAKRAQVMLAEAWAESLRQEKIDVVSLHPGWVATPGVEKSLPRFYRRLQKQLRDPRMGADTLVWLASRARLPGKSGWFWLDRRPRATTLLPGVFHTSQERDRLVQLLARIRKEA